MKHVIIDDNKCRIRINKRFYPEKIIEEAVETFDKDLNIKLENDEIIIKKEKTKINLEEKAYEFYDFLLSLIQGGS